MSERSEEAELVKALGKELDNTWFIEHVLQEMQRSGVMAALDQAPDITFAELRRSVIPVEDDRLLQGAGVDDPEAEITILIQYARKRLGHRDVRPSETVEGAREELKRAAERIANLSDNSSGRLVEVKKRRIFNGIGKILAGAVTGAGNLLLATGTSLHLIR